MARFFFGRPNGGGCLVLSGAKWASPKRADRGQGARRAMRGAGSVPPLSRGKASVILTEGDGAPVGATYPEWAAPCGTAAPSGAPPAYRSRQVARASAGFFWRLRATGSRPRHRFQDRASWDVARNGRYPALPVPAQRAPRRAVMVPPGRKPRNRPGAGSRPPPAGTAPSPVL